MFLELASEKAFELLLNNYAIIKNKNKDKVKKALLQYFETLGNNHEKTNVYRRKLSSLLFS